MKTKSLSKSEFKVKSSKFQSFGYSMCHNRSSRSQAILDKLNKSDVHQDISLIKEKNKLLMSPKTDVLNITAEDLQPTSGSIESTKTCTLTNSKNINRTSMLHENINAHNVRRNTISKPESDILAKPPTLHFDDDEVDTSSMALIILSPERESTLQENSTSNEKLPAGKKIASQIPNLTHRSMPSSLRMQAEAKVSNISSNTTNLTVEDKFDRLVSQPKAQSISSVKTKISTDSHSSLNNPFPYQPFVKESTSNKRSFDVPFEDVRSTKKLKNTESDIILNFRAKVFVHQTMDGIFPVINKNLKFSTGSSRSSYHLRRSSSLQEFDKIESFEDYQMSNIHGRRNSHALEAVACPLCRRKFSVEEIQEHAWRCSES